MWKIQQSIKFTLETESHVGCCPVCKNVRVVSVAQNSEAVKMESLVRTLLKENLGMNVDGVFEIERAHRCGPKPNTDAGFSRHILVKFLWFSAREAVLRTAQEKGCAEWKGQRIYFRQDLSRETIQKCRKYNEVKHQLRSMKDVSYAMLYPDTLKITVNNKDHLFTWGGKGFHLHIMLIMRWIIRPPLQQGRGLYNPLELKLDVHSVIWIYRIPKIWVRSCYLHT